MLQSVLDAALTILCVALDLAVYVLVDCVYTKQVIGKCRCVAGTVSHTRAIHGTQTG